MINVSKVLSYLALVVILQFVASQGCLASYKNFGATNTLLYHIIDDNGVSRSKI